MSSKFFINASVEQGKNMNPNKSEKTSVTSLLKMQEHLRKLMQNNLGNLSYADAIFFAEKQINLANRRLNEVNSVPNEAIQEMMLADQREREEAVDQKAGSPPRGEDGDEVKV